MPLAIESSRTGSASRRSAITKTYEDMIESVQPPIQNLALDNVLLGAGTWFGLGLVVGLILTLASIAALAMECLRPSGRTSGGT
jgi:hypothetical protein